MKDSHLTEFHNFIDGNFLPGGGAAYANHYPATGAVIGEVRGAEALDLLKAWGTGHPGGIGTIHAGSALGALRRLEQLIQEAVVTVPRAMIAETIDLIAVLSGRGSARRLSELARVEGLDATGDYQIQPLLHPGTGDHP